MNFRTNLTSLLVLFLLGFQLHTNAQIDPIFPCDCEPGAPGDTAVCVLDFTGEVFWFPSACLAECLELEVVPGADCEEPGGPIDPPPFPCDCDPLDPNDGPVCVECPDGTVILFPSECEALCLGLPIVPGDCDDPIDPIDPPFPCDCEPGAPGDTSVCVIDPAGIVVWFPSECLATCLGLEIVDEDCEEPGWPTDPTEPCDCDPLDPNDGPVCILGYDGNVEWFPSECLAICLELEIVDEECEEPGDPIDPPIVDCDCDPFGPDDEPTCILDENGESVWFPSLCLATCLELPLADEACDEPGWPIDPGLPCDCDPFDPNDGPVCVLCPDSTVAWFPSECLAICLELEIVDEECDEPENPQTPPFGNDPAFDLIDEIDQFVVYPNPVVGELNLQFNLEADGPVSIQILDLKGQTLQVKEVAGVIGQQRHQLDVQSLSPGVYFVQITTANQQISKRFIK